MTPRGNKIPKSSKLFLPISRNPKTPNCDPCPHPLFDRFCASKILLLSSQVPNFLRNPRIPLQFGVGEAWNRHGFLLQGPSRGGGLHHLHGVGQVWERGAHQVRLPRRHLVTLFYPRVEFCFGYGSCCFLNHLESFWVVADVDDKFMLLYVIFHVQIWCKLAFFLPQTHRMALDL